MFHLRAPLDDDLKDRSPLVINQGFHVFIFLQDKPDTTLRDTITGLHCQGF